MADEQRFVRMISAGKRYLNISLVPSKNWAIFYTGFDQIAVQPWVSFHMDHGYGVRFSSRASAHRKIIMGRAETKGRAILHQHKWHID